jgi:predicted amidohydrolase YtcJ
MIVERILYNANIHTLDDAQPRATALALSAGRIVAVGDDAALRALATRGTIMQDMDGATVWPGLIDAHIHWAWTSRALNEVDVFEVPSKAEALARVGARAARTPAGQWVVGWGWIQDVWDGRAFPTAADLDSVAPDHPVYLRAKSGHAGWANSAALRLCGIDASTPNPDGGQILRHADGQPTGVLLETAMSLVARHIPHPTPAQLADMMHTAQQHAHAAGLTGIHDFDNPDAMIALQILRERGDLGLRVLKNINQQWLEDALRLGIRWGFGDAWLRFGGLKLFADGALGPKTALMIDPYEGEPHNRGIVVVHKEQMQALVSRASAHGLPSTVHAIGDRAVRDVLDVYQAVRAEEAAHGIPRTQRRHRIEHVQIIHRDDLTRLAELDIIASMQPLHATSDYLMADRYWGARAALAYHPLAQLQQGVTVAFGSDSPIEPFAPFTGIHAAVTRQRADGSPSPDGWYPDARLTVAQALHGFTRGAAYTAGTEATQGQLRAGYQADLIVLDRDPHSIPPPELLQVQVLGTMVDGVWRYQR